MLIQNLLKVKEWLLALIDNNFNAIARQETEMFWLAVPSKIISN
jgi:hypothetical protein